MDWQMISSIASLVVFVTIILGIIANRHMINNYRVMNNLDLDLFTTRLKEHDMQIEMLCNRLKVQREESMAKAIADATMNPEKYTMGSFETITVEKKDEQVLESGV